MGQEARASLWRGRRPGRLLGAAGAAVCLLGQLIVLTATPAVAAVTGSPASAPTVPGTPTSRAAAHAGAYQSRTSTGQAHVSGRSLAQNVSPGYWMAASDGGVFQFNTPNLGGLRGVALNRPIVGMSASASGLGYWLVASDGGIFTFGDARYLGSTGSVRLNQPVVGMAVTPDGGGYWLVARDGGIFTFGGARYFGSTGSIRLNQPVVGMAATPDGGGYWLVARDGGIFTFGDARYFGSTGSIRLNQPVVGMAATPDGRGYWLVASDGGIFTFGDAGYFGSTGSIRLNQPVVAVGATPDGYGYWLSARDGGIFTFGDAGFLGSAAGRPGLAPVMSLAVTGHAYPYPPGSTGFDVSWPNCGSLPPAGSPVSIVGVNGGLIDDFNPCFAAEAAGWAGQNLTVYINVNLVPDGDPAVAMGGPAGACSPGDIVCEGYNWGFNHGAADVSFVQSQGYSPRVWWLDVEQPCGFGGPLWRCGGAQALASNARVIQGAIDAIRSRGLTAGIYSTYLQWPATVGPNVMEPGIPIWIATVPASPGAWAADCSNGLLQFAGGVPWLIQWLGGTSPTGFDQDLACAH